MEVIRKKMQNLRASLEKSEKAADEAEAENKAVLQRAEEVEEEVSGVSNVGPL